MRKLDKDGDKMINYGEFVEGVLPAEDLVPAPHYKYQPYRPYVEEPFSKVPYQSYIVPPYQPYMDRSFYEPSY